MYFSASEVVREGLRLLRGQDALRDQKIKALQEKIDGGVAELDRGEGIDAHAVLREIKQKSALRRRQRA